MQTARRVLVILLALNAACIVATIVVVVASTFANPITIGYRQVPGPDNPLGGAKFLFPNSYDIFLHDTPKKELFDKKKRAYSHGCIRVEDATKLAAHLLKDDPSWTTEKIEQAMKSGKEQYVRVKKPVPVMITYFTAWVDENGQMNFREDIYKHDLKTRERLFSKVSGSQPGLPQDSLRSDTSKKIS